MKKNKKGFSVIEVLLVIIVAGLLVMVAYYVGTKQRQNNSEESGNADSSSQEVTKTTTFKDKNGVYSFQLPINWTAEYPGTGLSASQFLTLKPSDFKAPGQENNWIASVTIITIPGEYPTGEKYSNFEQLKELKLQQTTDKNPVNKDLIINGISVWKFGETTEDNSATGPPEISGGYRDISYYYHKNSKMVVEVYMRAYQHGTTNYLGDKVTDAYNYSKYLPKFEEIAQSFKLN